MSEFATISDGDFELAEPGAHETFKPSLAVAPADGGALLLWVEQRSAGSENVSYDVSVNGNAVGTFAVKSEDSHSVHEIINSSWLKKGSNDVTFILTSNPGGVRLRDVALIFRDK